MLLFLFLRVKSLSYENVNKEFFQKTKVNFTKGFCNREHYLQMQLFQENL